MSALILSFMARNDIYSFMNLLALGEVFKISNRYIALEVWTGWKP